MRKRFYILFVARDGEGELRKIPIPLHYLYVFIAGAFIGMVSITGMAGSYTRMLLKVTRFNQLRTEKEALKTRYTQLEQANKEKDIQVASLGSLASEVSALYGLKSEPLLKDQDSSATSDTSVAVSMDQFYALRRTAMSGAATIGIGMGLTNRSASLSDWVRMAEAPNLWPVEGPITGTFGEREDPFNGEGAFHRGIDISTAFGTPVRAPADGIVTFAGEESGYGRLIQIEHSQSILTRYGHLSGFAVTEGQRVSRGQIIGYVGMSGRSTGPHLHYEVWVHNTPVNPYKFLRLPSTPSFAEAM
ncbi:MAG TPA: M23 family metallopeptidase [Terriglobales bacterium]|nr:M23 family metallopeptidase [Terriglobales bacterium]